MRFFKDMKIRWKLTCGFGFVLLLTVGVGAFAIIRLNGAAAQIEKMGELLDQLNNQSEVTYKSTLLGYPALREAGSLVMYLQAEDPEEQMFLFKRFAEDGKKFVKILEEVKKSGTSPDERKMIGEVEKLQKWVQAEAVNLIAIRDGEGEYGEETKEALTFFMNRIDGFVGTIEKLVTFQDKSMAEVQENSKEFISGARSTVKRAITIMVLVSILAVVIGVLVSLGLSRTIVTPLYMAVEVAKSVASGDLTQRNITTDSRDEVGGLLSALDSMKSNLNVMLIAISGNSGRLTSSSENLSASATKIARGSQEQTERASTVAAATHEMSRTIVEVAKNASGAVAAAKVANNTASRGGEIVSKTIESMHGIRQTASESSEVIKSLDSRSREIGNIIGVIDDIADQTNLLALNAAIEAARAGEQGRGFAVVADEVRKLAERTTKATKEISEMIKSIQDETGKALSSMEKEVTVVEGGVKLASDAGDALKEIVSEVEKVTFMIQQIASGSEQQSDASDQISGEIETVADITQETSKGAQQVELASGEIAGLASELKASVAMFRLSDEADSRAS